MFDIINYIIPRSMHEQFYGVISSNRHTPNQTRAEIPSNTAQAILQQPTSITQNVIVSRELPSETPSNTHVVAQTILNRTPPRRPLQNVLNEWAGSDRNRLLAVNEISTCITDQNSLLYLSSLSLTSLPDVFGYPELQHLQTLDLNYNRLTTLPESIGQLTALQDLLLRNNQLTALPASFGQLTALQTLDLDGNQLTTMPESIGQLTALQMLFLSSNHLTELPNFLRALLPNLQVHDLPFSVNIESITEEICRLAELQPSKALKQLYENATDGDSGQKALLRVWISRLKDTASGRVKNVNFYKSIVKILELASTNAPFAETFWNVIADAAATCGDRVALSILDLDIARQLMTLDPQKHLQVADFLKRGVWTYDLLKVVAVNKALMLRAAGTHFDEIEVHLGYFIKLKEALNLPISMQEMLYFRCSELTEGDLEAAKNYVLKNISNEDDFITFLIGQDQWKKTLRTKHPKELKSIEKAYAESDDLDGALGTYRTALKDLTKQLLTEPEVRSVASIKRA